MSIKGFPKPLIDCTPEEIALADQCLAKLHPGEPFFVLRGQDILAADAVDAWLTAALTGQPTISYAKSREAALCMNAMREWAFHHGKRPD